MDKERPAGTAASARLGALPDFVLERFFDRFEFNLPYQLGSSDPETLSVGELVERADAEMRERWATLRLGYRTTAGDPDLRAAIAATHPDRTAEDVVITTGAAEALLVAFTAMIEPGDRVVALTPAYQSLHELPRAMGARLELVEVREDGAAGNWRFPMDRLMDGLRPGVRVLVLNVPHNPTGVAATSTELRAIVAKCEQLRIRIIGDEVYRGLEWAGETAPSVIECSGRAVSVGVASKVYGLAGLRIGWLVSPDAALRRRAIAIKDYTTLCAAGPSEVLATIALRSHAWLLERTRARCLANLDTLAAFVAVHPDLVTWQVPAASPVSVAAIAPALLARHEGDAERVLAHWRERAGVLVVPGPAFGCAQGRFRLGFGRADLPEALVALAAAG
ncbi:MAG: aminotransferase class I/II-fold pyridoxal phosphate-dependent enzyme [Thermoanaerobaculales bacterium]